jgi:hypothetical protein
MCQYEKLTMKMNVIGFTQSQELRSIKRITRNISNALTAKCF